MTSMRDSLKNCRRIIVKIGTRSLVDHLGRSNKRRIQHFCAQMAALRQQGKEIILVSSGAIASGIEALNAKRRPTTTAGLQMAAAIGQIELITLYHRYFKKFNIHIGQILLTHDDLKNRTRHLNARNTLASLVSHNIIPIINENDVISTDEIKFGDNDLLSALVSGLVDADLLILLTTPDGLQNTQKNERIPYVSKIDTEVLGYIIAKDSPLSVGGMGAKLKACEIANQLGCPVVIAQGSQKNVLQKIIDGEDTGTLIGSPTELGRIDQRQRWIRYFHRPKGSVIIDDGAAEAILQKGKSLLAVGVKKIEGEFEAGALLTVQTLKGKRIAEGL